MVGAVLLVLIVIAAALAPVLAPHDPYAQDLASRLLPPVWNPRGSWLHVLGTDKLGRDYLSRLLYGARVSLVIGVCAASLSALIGTTLGVLAGYFGGRVDAVISYLITTRLAMPVVLVALAMSSLIGGSLKTVILLLGLLLWDASRWYPAPWHSSCATPSSSRPPAPWAPPRRTFCCANCCRTSRVR